MTPPKGARRALVAGGAGFLGSHLCEALLNGGAKVVALDSLITGRTENVKALIARGLEFVEGDLRTPPPLEGPFDEIYNLASPASPVDFSRIPIHIMETAAVGHREALELGLRMKARVLFASTSEVYGDAERHPQDEGYFGNVNPVGPRGCYDEAKRYGEALSLAYRRERSADVRIARIFNTYGPRMRPNDGRIIPNFFVQALQQQPLTVYGDGSQTRSFCYVDDLVAGLIALMRSDELQPVNIGNPIERTVMEIAERINAIVGSSAGVRRLPFPENDPLQRRPDISRAARALGWTPKIGLDEGLARTHAYFVEATRGAAIQTPNLV